MNKNWPYELPRPDANVVVNFSGGRSSAYMLAHLVDHYGGALPDRVKVVFCNTGREHPKTLEFVQRVGEHLDTDIVWLEYRYRPDSTGKKGDRKHTAVRVTPATASTDGRPFNELLESRKMLPNVFKRFCTSELKMMSIYRYMRDTHGWREWHSCLGIRYDEPRRVWKLLGQDCKQRPEKLPSLLPLHHAAVTKPMVLDYWRAQPFDLDLDEALGNCDMCFLKGKRIRARAIQLEPERAKWWAEWERKMHGVRGVKVRRQDLTRWDESITVDDLIQLAAVDDMVDQLDDDGQQDSCHCTD